ncbi:MAG: tRNA (adenosine(37)-N6)-threonylcarbamoyltransferase complex transferase subunit TsaD, partial [Bacteroidota bacterium]
AKQGDPNAVPFPKPFGGNDFEFSFSGIKTSVLYYLRDRKLRDTAIPERLLADICAGFQSAVIDVLVQKTIHAAQQYGVKEIAVAGGVSANSALRASMQQAAGRNGLTLFIPKPEYCTDNGAMIAEVGYRKYLRKMFSPLQSTAIANLELTS